MGPPTSTDRHPLAATGVAEARRRYREYRRRQGQRLLSLLPEGAVRPLYRRARERSGQPGPVADPLALLLDFCQEILPLPPFDVWLEDRRAHPAAHLDDVPDPGAGAIPPLPVTVDVRPVHAGGVVWNAALDVRPDGDVWRGHITFRTADGGSPVHPTGEIFREGDAGTVRERFRAFDDRTLQAFLRSVLP